MKNRVVITGLGVVAPNGVGLENFTKAIQTGTSGIQFHQALKDKGFSCCIGRIPTISDKKIAAYLLSQLKEEDYKPTKADVKKILTTAGVTAEEEKLNGLFAELDGKTAQEVWFI